MNVEMTVKSYKNENGYSLIELVVVITLLGLVLPSVFSLIAYVSVYSVQNTIRDRALTFAEQKLEEVIGQKEDQWDWYKNPAQFVVDEDLDDDFHRTLSVSSINNWGNAGIDAWEFNVLVSHPQLSDGVTLSVRLTKYHEE